NKLIQVYLQSNVDDKNRIADSTMSFINGRLELVALELTDIEKEIESYKKTTGLTDISEQSRQLLSSSSDYIKQLTQQQVQLSILESLEKYLDENPKGIVPTSMVVQDPAFVGLINNYNTIQLERERTLMTTN